MSKERFGVVVVSKGKFIVVEGLDGCGKSTQIELISKKLKAMGKLVYITAEPTNYETGAYLRRILSESIDKDMYLQGALFLADRIEHITHPEFGIKKYLDQGYHVICDRYYFSTFAYQKAKEKRLRVFSPRISQDRDVLFQLLFPKVRHGFQAL